MVRPVEDWGCFRNGVPLFGATKAGVTVFVPEPFAAGSESRPRLPQRAGTAGRRSSSSTWPLPRRWIPRTEFVLGRSLPGQRPRPDVAGPEAVSPSARRPDRSQRRIGRPRVEGGTTRIEPPTPVPAASPTPTAWKPGRTACAGRVNDQNPYIHDLRAHFEVRLLPQLLTI
jgi:hypothetical protein